MCNDLDLLESELKVCTQNLNGKSLKLENLQREHTVNRVSSLLPKGGHTAFLTELTKIVTFIRSDVIETNIQSRQQRTKKKLPHLNGRGGLNPLNGANRSLVKQKELVVYFA